MGRRDYVSPIRQLEKAVVRLQQGHCRFTVRSSNSIGHRLRRSLLGTGDSAQTTVESPAPMPEVSCSGKVVTTTGDRHTESSTSGCEPSSTDGIRTVDASIPRGTATIMQWTSLGDPGGGTVSTVSPRRMTIDGRFSCYETVRGGGGGLSWSPSGF